MKRFTLFIFLFSFISITFSQDFSLFQKKELITKDGKKLPFRVLYPKNYDKTKKYPLVVFLHGMGERGTDNEKQLKYGASIFLDEKNRNKYPAIILVPQCPENDTWAPREFNKVTGERIFRFHKNPNESLLLVKSLLDHYRKKEAVDKNRIYVIGMSMGAMGTFDIILRYPKYFASAVGIAGGVDAAKLKRVKKLPIRIYHGREDDVVSVEFSRQAYYYLKAFKGNVEYKEYIGVNHSSWVNALVEPDFLDWIFRQRRK